MTTVVLNSAGEIERLTTGKAPERPEIVADNAKQRGETKPEPAKAEAAKEPAKEAPKESTDSDDVEDHDGLTPREKRELSEKMQRAVAKRHREKKEAEKFAADQYNNARLAEQRAEELEQELAKLRGQQQQSVQKPTETPKPERSNFETDEAYQDALVDWKVDQKLKKQQAEDAEKRQREEQAEIARLAHERLEKAAELVTDFIEVTEATELRIPGHIAAYMQRSPMFAELGYHFAKHPDIIERLAKLHPADALVEVGEIKSTLQPFASRSAAGAGEKTSKPPNTESASPTAANGNGAGPSPTESASSGAGPKQSRAPVIKPLNVNSASQVEKPLQEMTYDEARADWEKRRGVSLDRRKRH